jgi:hypothetical protein
LLPANFAKIYSRWKALLFFARADTIAEGLFKTAEDWYILTRSPGSLSLRMKARIEVSWKSRCEK